MGDLASALGLAMRAGKLAWGLNASLQAQSLPGALVLIASDAGNSVRREVLHHGLPGLTIELDKVALGAAIGRGSVAIVTVLDEGIAMRIRALLRI